MHGWCIHALTCTYLCRAASASWRHFWPRPMCYKVHASASTYSREAIYRRGPRHRVSYISSTARRRSLYEPTQYGSWKRFYEATLTSLKKWSYFDRLRLVSETSKWFFFSFLHVSSMVFIIFLPSTCLHFSIHIITPNIFHVEHFYIDDVHIF